MKTRRYLLWFACMSIVPTFAQDRMKPNESNCKEVVDYLRERHRNDAVAMAILKKEYRIIKCNANCDSVLKKPPTQIIQYFDTEEGKVCFCRSKIQRPEPMNMNELYILLAE